MTKIRDEAIAAAFASGEAMPSIARRHGVSRQRVQQILKHAALGRYSGGLCVAAERRRACREILADLGALERRLRRLSSPARELAGLLAVAQDSLQAEAAVPAAQRRRGSSGSDYSSLGITPI